MLTGTSEGAKHACEMSEDAQAVLALARWEPEDAMVQKPCPHADYESRGTDTCGEHVSRDGECGHSEPSPPGRFRGTQRHGQVSTSHVRD